MKKITITNVFSWYNKGDSGILLATIDSLENIYGKNNIEINLLSFYPELDKKKYCIKRNVKNVYSNILNPHPYKRSKFGKIYAIIKLFLKFLYYQFNLKFNFKKFTNKKNFLNVLKDSDVIIVCGGGFLGGNKLKSLMHVYQIYVNTLFDKPVYMMGTSIEPITNGLLKHYTEKVLKRVDYIFAREEITEKYLSTFLPKTKYELIPDMAFMLIPAKQKFKFIDDIRGKTEYIFGITVRKWNFPTSKNREKSNEQYIISVKETIEYFVKKYNCKFLFIPQVIVSNGNDSIMANVIKERLSNDVKDKFIINSDDWSPSEIKSMIGCMDFFIGTRMHSNIFATSMFVPTVAISYEKKTDGIMKMLGLDDYVVDINSITSKELISKVENMIANNQTIRKNLNERVNVLQKLISKKLEKCLISKEM